MKKEYILYEVLTILTAVCIVGAIKIISLERELKKVRTDVYNLPIDDLQSDLDRVKSDVNYAMGRIGDLEDWPPITTTTETRSY